MATLLELFTEEDFALIFEALESRKKHYEQRIPQQTIDPIAGVDHDDLSYEPDTPVRGDVVPGDGGVKCVVLYPKA